MEIEGKIKVINDTQEVGSKGFKKRTMVITTDEQYPQIIQIEFVQDKVDLLDKLTIGDMVKIHINLRGREWTNPEGEVIVFNTIQGWRVEANGGEKPPSSAELKSTEPDDLPF